eukprot:scaffold6898_cov123-Cylindrotheca_fusiformis.AAC.5
MTTDGYEELRSLPIENVRIVRKKRKSLGIRDGGDVCMGKRHIWVNLIQKGRTYFQSLNIQTRRATKKRTCDDGTRVFFVSHS